MNIESFSNFLRLAFRDTVIAILGILCLIIGLASVLVVAVHLLYLNSFESHIERSDDVYRLVVDMNSRSTGQPYELSFSSDAYAELLESNYPAQIERVGRLMPFSGVFVFPGGESNNLDFHFVDESIIDIFEFDFLEGTEDALGTPYSVLISSSFAERYFGGESALGASLSFNDENLNVTGVFRDFPRNTHMRFDVVVSSDTGRRLFSENFMNRSPWIEFRDTRTYVRLHPGVNVGELIRDFPSFIDRNIPDNERALAEQTNFSLGLQPIRRIHIDPREGAFNGVDNSIRVTLISLVVFSAIILSLSFINYLSLSVSRLLKRSREISIRRVIGATGKDLVFQFVGESGAVVILSFILAVPLIYAVFPIYSYYVGIDLSIEDIPFINVFVFVVLLLTVMSLVAGLFSLYVISNGVNSDLQGGAYKSVKGLRVSIIGSIFQVSLSLILVMISVSIYLHTESLHESDLGFDHEGLVIVDLRESPSSSTLFDHSRLISDLSSSSYITAVSSTTFHPGRTVGFIPWSSSEMLPGDTAAIGYVIVDERFTDVYGLTLVEGRTLSAVNSSDVMPSFSAPDGGFNAIVTDYASSVLGFDSPADAIGGTIQSASGRFTIVGVVDSFRLSSLHGNQNSPGVILASSRPMQFVNLRYDTEQEASVLQWLDGVLRDASVRNEFEFSLYRDIETDAIDARAEGVSVAAISSAMTSLLITILGFVAVVIFLSSVKSSSTAIRRMLGAGAFQSVRPMLKDIYIVLLVSFLISILAILFIEKLVGSLLGGATVEFLYYLTISFVVCSFFSILAFLVSFLHNRKVLGAIYQ